MICYTADSAPISTTQSIDRQINIGDGDTADYDPAACTVQYSDYHLHYHHQNHHMYRNYTPTG